MSRFLTSLLVLDAIFAAVLLAQDSPAASDGGTRAPGKETRKDGDGNALPAGALARLGTRRLRAKEPVLSVAWSPDGKTLASGTHRGVAQLWDAATGKQLPSSPLPGSEGHQVGFTPTNKPLAFHWPFAVSPDGTLVAGGFGGLAAVRKLKDESVQFSLVADNQGAVSFAFSPDGKTLASGGGESSGAGDATIRLWDVKAGKVVGRLAGHKYQVNHLAFVLGGDVLLSASQSSFEPVVRLWDVKKRKQISTLDTYANAFAVSPDGKKLATSDATDVIRIWDLAERKKIREFSTSGGALLALAFSPDGKRVVSGGWGQGVGVWDVATGREVFALPGHREAVDAVVFSPDGQLLASRGWGYTVRVWDRASGKEIRRLEAGHRWRLQDGVQGPGLTFSPDGTHLAAAGSSGPKNAAFLVWAWPSGKRLSSFAEPPARPSAVPPLPFSLMFSPDGRTLVSTAQWFRLWPLPGGQNSRILRNPQKPDLRDRHPDSILAGFMAGALSPDGRTLAGGIIARGELGKATILLMDPGTGALLRTVPGQKGTTTGLAFSPTGHLLASCRGSWPKPDPTINLWETATGTRVRSFQGHSGGVACVALSPGGRLLASAGMGDNTARLWDVATGKQLAKFEGHAGPVLSVAFAPDGLALASASQDTTILLWDLRPFRPKPVAPPAGDKALAALWDALPGREAAKPHEAVWSLVGAGDRAVSLLRGHLHPAPAPDPDRVRRLLQDLDSNDFDTREKAAAELARLGPPAEPLLRKALAGELPAGVRKRLKALVEELRLRPATAEDVRQSRALLALELIGSPAARELLKALAGGAPGAALSRDAKAALARLDRKAKGR